LRIGIKDGEGKKSAERNSKYGESQ